MPLIHLCKTGLRKKHFCESVFEKKKYVTSKRLNFSGKQRESYFQKVFQQG